MGTLRQYTSFMLGRLSAAPSVPEEGPGLGFFVNSRGARLQTREWQPEGKLRGIVVFCHGYSTEVTANRAWQRVADMHTASNLLCAGFDYQGHGRSEGARMRLESFELLVADILQFVDALRARHPDLPIFLRGQSLGGLLSVAAALKWPELFSGLTLGAPAFELSWSRWALLRASRVLVGAVAPTAILDGQASVGELLGQLVTPIGVFQGVEDGTVNPVGARHLVAGAGSQDKSLYLYQDMGHNMSIEPDVHEWLLARLPSKDGRATDAPPLGAVLHVRSPVPGVAYKPPPPGSADANANTQLETLREPEQQGARLDALFGERGAVPLGGLRRRYNFEGATQTSPRVTI